MRRRMFLRGMFVAACMFAAGDFIAGCGIAVATWISLGMSLVSTVIPLIPGIVQSIAKLLGKTLTAAQVQKLTAVFTKVGNLLEQVQTAINQFSITSNPTLLQTVRNLIAEVQSNLTNLVMDVGITDPATVSKVSAIVNEILGLAEDVLNILPIATTNGVLEARRIPAKTIAKIQPATWAASFNAAVQKPSGNPVVDAAFASVVAVPKAITQR